MSNDQRLMQRWLLNLSKWLDMQRRLTALGSHQIREREAAIDWFVFQGIQAIPALRRALRGSVSVACSAATALYRLGDAHGIRTVLVRCYEEEWLTRCYQDGHLAELRALRRLGHGTIAAVLTAAFEDATRERDGACSLEALIVTLSSLRVLGIFKEGSPQSLFERAVHLGPSLLPSSANSPFRPVAISMTHLIRIEGISRLVHEYPDAGSRVLIEALNCKDRQVAATAIDGLQLLRDRKALPHLQNIAFQTGHALAAHARRAIEHIAGSHADALILMRAAQEPSTPEELLRPATEKRKDSDAKTLVRSVAS